VAAAALIALAIMAGLVGTVWQARAAARERDQARREQAKAEQLNRFLQGILSAASPEEKGRDAKVIEVLNDAAARVETEFSAQPALKGQALLTIGQTYNELGLEEQAEKTLREALSVNAALYGAEDAQTASSAIYLGVALMNKGSIGEAEPILTRAVETERRLFPGGSKELATALFVQGETCVRKGEFAKAQTLLQESASMSERLAGRQDEDFAFTLVSLARAKSFSGDLDGAEAILRQSIAVLRGATPRYEGRMATALLNLGHLLSQRGKYEEALAALGEADRIYQKQGESFFLFESKVYLCTAAINAGDHARSAAEGGRALEIGRRLSLQDTPDFIIALEYVGLSVTRTGKPKAAEPLLRESLGRAGKTFPAGDVRVPLIESALGECLTAQNRFAEAEPLVVHAYETLKAGQGEKSPLTALAAKRAAELYGRWRKPDLAAEYRTTTPQS
jgi:serine/threonine-protein kinase